LKKIILSLILVCCITSFAKASYLVEINSVKYSPVQFKIWWKFWKDKNTPFPKTPEKFINWILLSNEAKFMNLDEEPNYKHKLNIFLQVRSLLQLRYDEVEKKIKINPDTLMEYYNKKFSPFYGIKILMSDNVSECAKWKSEIKSKEDFNKIFERLKTKGKARNLGWKRPINIPEVFKKIVFNAEENKIYGPIKYKKIYYLIVVTDKFAGSKKDFQKIHKEVAYSYRKYMDNILTKDLIERLKKKYPVTVKWNYINKIKPFDNISSEISKKVVIEIGDKKLTGEKFKHDLEKDINTRGLRKKLDGKRLKEIKKFLVQSIISQTLTTMEALNRHYEKSVMKDIFWFYKRNRLIKEFENKIILPKVKITDAEIKKYYNEHKKDFTTPDLVEISVIQTHDEKLIKNAYKRIKNGESFYEIAREVQFHGAKPETRRMDNLVKELRDRVKIMKDGEISPIIKYKDWFFIVKLIKKEKKKLHEFEKVKKSIKNIIFKEKFKKLEDEYLEKLKNRSKIKINEKEWAKIKKELGGINE